MKTVAWTITNLETAIRGARGPQGNALDAKARRPADLTVERIGDLLTDLPALLLPEMTR